MHNQIRHMQQQLDQSPHLRRLGRLFSETVLLGVGNDEYYLTFEKGRLVEYTTGPSRKIPYRFAFHSDADALFKFWEKTPPPGFHDIFGLVKIGRGSITGDILVLVKNLRFFKAVLAFPRELQGDKP